MVRFACSALDVHPRQRSHAHTHTHTQPVAPHPAPPLDLLCPPPQVEAELARLRAVQPDELRKEVDALRVQVG